MRCIRNNPVLTGFWKCSINFAKWSEPRFYSWLVRYGLIECSNLCSICYIITIRFLPMLSSSGNFSIFFIFRGTTIMVQKIISQYGLKVEGQLRLLKIFELSITSSFFSIIIRLHPLRHLYTTFPLHLLLLHQSRNNLGQFSLGIKGGLEFKSSSKSR